MITLTHTELPTTPLNYAQHQLRLVNILHGAFIQLVRHQSQYWVPPSTLQLINTVLRDAPPYFGRCTSTNLQAFWALTYLDNTISHYSPQLGPISYHLTPSYAGVLVRLGLTQKAS